jgi:hypothetical protein
VSKSNKCYVVTTGAEQDDSIAVVKVFANCQKAANYAAEHNSIMSRRRKATESDFLEVEEVDYVAD